jgi:hypothetical protein
LLDEFPKSKRLPFFARFVKAAECSDYLQFHNNRQEVIGLEFIILKKGAEMEGRYFIDDRQNQSNRGGIPD